MCVGGERAGTNWPLISRIGMQELGITGHDFYLYCFFKFLQGRDSVTLLKNPVTLYSLKLSSFS